MLWLGSLLTLTDAAEPALGAPRGSPPSALSARETAAWLEGWETAWSMASAQVKQWENTALPSKAPEDEEVELRQKTQVQKNL